MSGVKPLTWAGTSEDPVPDCGTCARRWRTPWWQEAVWSVGIEHPGDPVQMGQRALTSWHINGHRD